MTQEATRLPKSNIVLTVVTIVLYYKNGYLTMELDRKENLSHHTHEILWIFRTLDPVYPLSTYTILDHVICYLS